MLHVAKDWNHDTLAPLPGFRDRIGTIQLTRQEGGLNLSMDPELVRTLTEYGRMAGELFVQRFGRPQPSFPEGPHHPMDWGNHQIIRLRLLLASIAELLGGLGHTCQTLQSTAASYERFFDPSAASTSYSFNGLGNLTADSDGLYYTQAGLALEVFNRLQQLAVLIEATNKARPETRLDYGAPRPAPELRPRPRI